jgi:hypothetical protein
MTRAVLLFCAAAVSFAASAGTQLCIACAYQSRASGALA